MKSFSRLIRFESASGEAYFADLGANSSKVPALGSSISAYKSFDDLANGRQQVSVTIDKVPVFISPVVKLSLLNILLNLSCSLRFPGTTYPFIALASIIEVMHKRQG